MSTYTVEIVTLEALASGASAVGTAVTGYNELDFTRRLNDTPESWLTLRNNHPLFSSVAYDRVLRVKLNGVPKHAFIVEKRHKVKHDPDGPHKQVTSFRGRPLSAVLDRGRVQPTLGWGRKPYGPSRTLSFASPEYVPDGAWTTATVIVAHQQDDSTSYGGMPDGFVAVNAALIGPSSGDDTQAPIGHWYLIFDFDLDEDATLYIPQAGDNAWRSFFDGFALAAVDVRDDTTTGFRTTHASTIFATAGPHRYAVKVTNTDFSGDEPGYGAGATLPGNPTMFLAACYKVGGNGQLGDRVWMTDDTWPILEYPDAPPAGVNVGWAGRILLDEIQADGILQGLTTSFTDTEDSAGHAWDDLESITVNVDDTLLTVLKNWALSYCDFDTPAVTQRWDMWRWAERGLDSTPVTYAIAGRTNTDLTKLEFDGEHLAYDCLSVTWAGGNFRYPSSGGSKMGVLKTNCRTKAEALALAVKRLEEPDIEQVLLEIEPHDNAHTPLVGPNEGDTITTYGIDAGTADERLMEINARATDIGLYKLQWKIALRDVRLSDVDRLQRELQRAAGGNGGGLVASSPVDPPPIFGSKVTASEITFHHQGPVDTGFSEVHKSPKSAINLYGVKLKLPLTEDDGAGTLVPLVTTGPTSVSFLIDGTIVGSGTIVAGESVAFIAFDPILWVQPNNEMLDKVTARADEAHDLLVEPAFV